MSELVLEKNESIPYNWIHTTIGEISSKIHYGYTTKSTKEKIGLKYLRITDIQNNSIKWEDVPSCQTLPKNLSEFLLRSNDLVFARTGATVGKSFLMKNPPESVFASYLIRIILSEKIYANYVNYFFKSSLYWNQIRSGSVGMAQPNFNATKLSKIKIPLPPLNEQKRIVAKIEELFSLLDSTKQLLEKTKILLKQYRQSLLKSAFEGKLVPQDPNDEPTSVLLEKIRREKSSKPNTRADLSIIELVVEDNVLPYSWIWTTIDQICRTSSGGTPSRSKKEYYGGSIPWIKSGELKDSIITNSEEKITKIGLENSSAKIFPKGTVLLALYGATTGKTAILHIDATTNQAVCALFNDKHILDANYLLWYLRFIRKNLIQKSIGGAQPNISQEIVNKLKIPLPPLNEQKRIVEKIEESFSLIQNSEKLVDSLLLQNNSMKNSILKQAFDGKLVPQDPNDESAEILLQKIKQEKQLIQKQKPSRSTKNVK